MTPLNYRRLYPIFDMGPQASVGANNAAASRGGLPIGKFPCPGASPMLAMLDRAKSLGPTMQNPINLGPSAIHDTDAALASDTDMACLNSLKSLRQNTGLTLDFWADVTELLDQKALEGLVAGSVNAAVASVR